MAAGFAKVFAAALGSALGAAAFTVVFFASGDALGVTGLAAVGAAGIAAVGVGGAALVDALVALLPCALGRPVFSVGTAARADLKAPSFRPLSTVRPARSSSLFFTDVPSAMARVLSRSMTAYSALGMVKLSRTSFWFLVVFLLAMGSSIKV